MSSVVHIKEEAIDLDIEEGHYEVNGHVPEDLVYEAVSDPVPYEDMLEDPLDGIVVESVTSEAPSNPSKRSYQKSGKQRAKEEKKRKQLEKERKAKAWIKGPYNKNKKKKGRVEVKEEQPESEEEEEPVSKAKKRKVSLTPTVDYEETIGEEDFFGDGLEEEYQHHQVPAAARPRSAASTSTTKGTRPPRGPYKKKNKATPTPQPIKMKKKPKKKKKKKKKNKYDRNGQKLSLTKRLAIFIPDGAGIQSWVEEDDGSIVETDNGDIQCPHPGCQDLFDANTLVAMIDHYCAVHRPKLKAFICPEHPCSTDFKPCNSIVETFWHAYKVHRVLVTFEELVERSMGLIAMDGALRTLCAAMVRRQQAVNEQLCSDLTPIYHIKETFVPGVRYIFGSTHNGRQGFECPYPECDKSVFGLESLLKHYVSHRQDVMLYKCAECDAFKTNDAGNLRTHILSKHGMSSRGLQAIRNNVNEEALEDIMTKNIYTELRRTILDPPTFKELHTAVVLLTHCPSTHILSQKTKTPLWLLSCPFPDCDYALKSKGIGTMIGHICHVHIKITAFRCTLCDGGFNVPGTLESHYLSSHGKKMNYMIVLMAHPAFSAVAKYLFNVENTIDMEVDSDVQEVNSDGSEEEEEESSEEEEISKPVQMPQKKKPKPRVKREVVITGPSYKKWAPYMNLWPEADTDIHGIKHRAGNYLCPRADCTGYESSFHDLMGHMLLHNYMKPFHCGFSCTASYENTRPYIKHMMNHHGKELTCLQVLEFHSAVITSTEDPDLAAVYEGAISECHTPSEAKLSQAESLLKSVQPQASSISLVCPVTDCPNADKTFSFYFLTEHINRFHALIRPFGCTFCAVFMNSSLAMSAHLNKLHDQHNVKPLEVIMKVQIYKEAFERLRGTTLDPSVLQSEAPARISRRKLSIQEEELDTSDLVPRTSFPDRTGDIECPFKGCNEVFDSNTLVDMIDHYSTVHVPELKPFSCPVPKCWLKNNASIFETFDHVYKYHHQVQTFVQLVEHVEKNNVIEDENLKTICRSMVTRQNEVDAQLTIAREASTLDLTTIHHTIPCLTEVPREQTYNPTYHCPSRGDCNYISHSLEALLKHYISHGDDDDKLMFQCPEMGCTYLTTNHGVYRSHLQVKHRFGLKGWNVFDHVNEDAISDGLAMEIYREYRRACLDPATEQDLQTAVELLTHTTTTRRRKSNSKAKLAEVRCPYPSCPFTNDKTGTALIYMIGHVNTAHMKISPFKCTLCDMLFPIPLSLDNHSKYVHGKTKPASGTIMAHPAFSAVGKLMWDLETGAVINESLEFEEKEEEEETNGEHLKEEYGQEEEEIQEIAPSLDAMFPVVPNQQDRKKYSTMLFWPEESSDIPGIKHQGGYYLCPKQKCSWFEFDLQLLLCHLLRHQGLLPFKCADCSMEFDSSRSYMTHTQKVHGDSFNLSDALHSISNYIQSSRDQALKAVYKAAYDNCNGPSEEKLQEAEWLLNNAIPVQDGPEKVANFKCPADRCPFADQVFILAKYVEHVNKCHALIRPFSCDSCGLYQSSNVNIVDHMRLFHQQKIKPLEIMVNVPIYKTFYETHRGPLSEVPSRMITLANEVTEWSPQLKEGVSQCPVEGCELTFDQNSLVDMIEHYCTFHKSKMKPFACPMERCSVNFKPSNSILELFSHIFRIHKQYMSFPEMIAASTYNDEKLGAIIEAMVLRQENVNSELKELQDMEMDDFVEEDRSIPGVLEAQNVRDQSQKHQNKNGHQQQSTYHCPKPECAGDPPRLLLGMLNHYMGHEGVTSEDSKLFVCNGPEGCHSQFNFTKEVVDHLRITHGQYTHTLSAFKLANEKALLDPVALALYKEYRRINVDPPNEDEVLRAAACAYHTTAVPHAKRYYVTIFCPFPSCNAQFSQAKSTHGIIGHINTVHFKISPFRCTLCDFGCPHPVGLENHWIHKHGKKRMNGDIMMASPAYSEVCKFLSHLEKKALGIGKKGGKKRIKAERVKEEELELDYNEEDEELNEVQEIEYTEELASDQQGYIFCPIEGCDLIFNQDLLVDMIEHYCTVHKPNMRPFACPIKRCNVNFKASNSILELFSHMIKLHRQLMPFPKLFAYSVYADEHLRALFQSVIVRQKAVDSAMAKLKGLELDPNGKEYDDIPGVPEIPPVQDIRGSGTVAGTVYLCPRSECAEDKPRHLATMFAHYMDHDNVTSPDSKLFVCNWSEGCNYQNNSIPQMASHFRLFHMQIKEKYAILKMGNESALIDPAALGLFREMFRLNVDPPNESQVLRAAAAALQTTAQALKIPSGRGKHPVLTLCPFPSCNASFKKCSSYHVIAHINVVHFKITPFRCSLCEFGTAAPEAMEKHWANRHGKKRSNGDVIMSTPAFTAVGKYLFQMEKETSMPRAADTKVYTMEEEEEEDVEEEEEEEEEQEGDVQYEIGIEVDQDDYGQEEMQVEYGNNETGEY